MLLSHLYGPYVCEMYKKKRNSCEFLFVIPTGFKPVTF